MKMIRIAGMAVLLGSGLSLAAVQTAQAQTQTQTGQTHTAQGQAPIGQIAGQQVSGSTSCADALKMQAQAGPQGNAALKQRIAVLMKTYAPQGIDGKGGMPSPEATDMALAYGTRWCQRHPERTLADAAKAAQKSQNKLLSILMNQQPASDAH